MGFAMVHRFTIYSRFTDIYILIIDIFNSIIVTIVINVGISPLRIDNDIAITDEDKAK